MTSARPALSIDDGPQSELKQRLEPTQAGERFIEVDIVRGVALLGIVLVNYHSRNLTGVFNETTADRLSSVVISTFFDGKFYPLFSMLFGFGMSVQSSRARLRSERFEALYLRRLAVLFGLGLLHYVLIWKGDILHVYAFWGLFLLLFCRASNKVLLTMAAILIAAAVSVQEPLLNSLHLSARSEAITREQQAELYKSASYSTMLVARSQRIMRATIDIRTNIPMMDILGMFLLGLFAGRRGLFQESASNSRLIRRVLWTSLGIGTLGVAWGSTLQRLALLAGDRGALSAVVQFLSRPSVTATVTLYHKHALAVFYCCLLFRLLRRSFWLRLLRPFAGIGRMALTNYLTQCLIASMIFYGYGLGMYGKLGALWGAAIAIAVYLCQIPLSAWWLKRFRFGPVEWVWRSLTYWKPQPMLAAEAGLH